MFRITYIQGNGYKCSCCRSTWTNTEDLNTEQEVQAFIDKFQADKEFPLYEDDDDKEITEIREIKDEDLTDKFTPNREVTDKIINERKAAKQKEKDKEVEDQKKDDLRLLKTLKAKYEGETK